MSRPLIPSDQTIVPPPMPVQAEPADSPSNTTPPPPLPVAMQQDSPVHSASPLAEAFPRWDLMPPAEFIKRARR